MCGMCQGTGLDTYGGPCNCELGQPFDEIPGCPLCDNAGANEDGEFCGCELGQAMQEADEDRIQRDLAAELAADHAAYQTLENQREYDAMERCDHGARLCERCPICDPNEVPF